MGRAGVAHSSPATSTQVQEAPDLVPQWVFQQLDYDEEFVCVSMSLFGNKPLPPNLIKPIVRRAHPSSRPTVKREIAPIQHPRPAREQPHA